MTRQEALAQPNTEPLLNGRCIGQTYLDPDYGTVLQVIHCEHPDGRHVPWPEPGWQL